MDMEYTYAIVFLLNIPLVLSEYICCIILTYALIKQKPSLKMAGLMFIPYCLIIVLPSSVFFMKNLFGNVFFVVIVSFLESAGWTLVLHTAYRLCWEKSLLTGAMTVFLYGTLEELGGFFIRGNFDLSIPGELMMYMVSSIAEILLLGIIVSGIILKLRLHEVYNGFLSADRKNYLWKAVIILLPVLKILSVEIANERLVLNNSNPMISLLFLLLVMGVLNDTFRCGIQKKQLQEQQASLEQQKMYIQSLESVQRDVRVFRHDFKNRMAGIRIQADEGDLKAVQTFISEVTGDFEKKMGEKIFQISQLGFLQKSMESSEDKKQCKVTALFCGDESGVSIIIRNPVKEPVPLSKIWKNGYSTKGPGRGIGLASLRRIVESYDNVSSRSYEEDGLFVQELNIGTGERRI